MKWSLRIAMIFLPFLLLGLCSCSTREKEGSHRLRVVTTLFPVYDFARVVGGDKVEVTLLLPPGVEAHSFEPKPEDVLRIHKADMFIFTSTHMEPWVPKLLSGVTGSAPTVVEAGARAAFIPIAGDEHPDKEAGHAHNTLDPHIWLSIPNAQTMVDAIAAGLAKKAPEHREYFLRNAQTYNKRLAELDQRFRGGLAQCETRTLLHGGHYAFGYLAARYGLTYRSAYAISANAEPSPRRIMDLVKEMKNNRLRAIFYEELLSPAMAQTIARESGAELVKLHGIHNVTKADLEGGATYLSLMEQNLENLRRGLRCR